MTYLLDANVFIEAENRYYDFDFCPAFWDWLIHRQDIVCSIDKVKEELLQYNDELTTWVKENIEHISFKPFDEESTAHFKAINRWMEEQKYKPAAIDKFRRDADYYLIAYAKAHGLTVVTQEVSAPHAKKIIKIPDVCEALRIECMNTFDMLKIEKARFVLPSLDKA